LKTINVESKVKKQSKAHYSSAVVHNGIVYISGQLPMNPETGEPVKGSIEVQALTALQNVQDVLSAAGSSIDKVLRTTAYIPDVGDWGKVNEVYAEVFGEHKPARTVVPSRDLHYGCLIEVDAVAYIAEDD
jgi:2-iminobutanoate/2-iminopropanoate deaminase